MMPDDVTLRDAYRRRSPAAPARSPLPVETLEALAQGRYAGADREALLERILSDPAQAAEFHFLHDVAHRPVTSRRAWWSGTRGLALAAGGILAVFAGTRLFRPATDDPMRSSASIQLQQPAANATVPSGDSLTFAWSPVADAVEYEVNVAAADGTELLRAALTDTTLRRQVPAGASTWWVTARRADGTTERSSARSLTAR